MFFAFITFVSAFPLRNRTTLYVDSDPARVSLPVANLTMRESSPDAGNDIASLVNALNTIDTHVDGIIQSRAISQNTLSQLQTFIDTSTNLLRAIGKGGDVVNTFLSQVNNLKSEAQNGSLDAGDLLGAANGILQSLL